MTNEELLNQFFDDLLFQIEKGLTYEQLEKEGALNHFNEYKIGSRNMDIHWAFIQMIIL